MDERQAHAPHPLPRLHVAVLEQAAKERERERLTMAEDIIRVLRVIEYEGPRAWVESALEHRGVKGTLRFHSHGGECVIREAVVGETPTLIQKGRD
jgi:hypothetical protein